MTRTNYQRGRDFEYRTRKKLLDNGAVYVMRAAQSKGAADLLALLPHRGSCGTFHDVANVWLIQCKRDGRLPKKEREVLLDIAARTGTIPVLAKTGPNGRGVVFINLYDDKEIEHT